MFALFDRIISYVFTVVVIGVIPYTLLRFNYEPFLIIMFGLLLLMDAYYLSLIHKVVTISNEGFLTKHIFGRSKNLRWEDIEKIDYNYKMKSDINTIRLRRVIAVFTKKKTTRKSKYDFDIDITINKNEKNTHIIREYEEKYFHVEENRNNI